MAENPHQNNKNRTRRVALGGVFAALAVVIMLLGGLIPIATFTAPSLAGLCLLPILMEFGSRTALIAYAAISILSFFMVPDREMALLFIFLLGYYPVLQQALARIRSKWPRYAIKLLVFNAAVAAVYVCLLLLFPQPALVAEFAAHAPWFWGGMLLAGNAIFFVYDILVDKVRIIYQYRIRKMIFR